MDRFIRSSGLVITALYLGMLVSASSTFASPLDVPGCSNMIDTKSDLYSRLQSVHSVGNCMRVTEAGGHTGYRLEIQSDRQPTSDGKLPQAVQEPQLSYLRITRYELDSTRPLKPHMNQQDDVVVMRELGKTVSVLWGIGSVDAVVFRLDDVSTGMSNSCLYADTWGSLGAFTRAIVCWSVRTGATDSEIMDVANKYVAASYSAIHP